MTPDAFEQQTRAEASQFAFIRSIATLNKTAHTIKLRLYIDSDCFVQVYANVHKNLLSYTLVLHQSRVYGRDNDGAGWHRHPYSAPETHDFGREGVQPVSLMQFLDEVQQFLTAEGLL